MNRQHLLLGTALLALIQLGHLLDVLRYSDTATFPSVLFDPLGIFGVGISVLAFLAVAARLPGSVTFAGVVGAGIAIGFTLYHGLPIDVGMNNPYWTFDDGNHADFIQWATVVGVAAVGGWTAVAAFAPRMEEERETSDLLAR